MWGAVMLCPFSCLLTGKVSPEQCVFFYFKPSFLAMAEGMAFLWIKMFIVL